MRTLAIIAAILLATSASGLSETTPPGRVVESLHSGLLTSMKDAATLGYDGRYEHLQGVLQQTFDLAFMAEKSVGRHWKKLGESEQEISMKIGAVLAACSSCHYDVRDAERRKKME